MKSWIYFGWGKSKNLNSIICRNTSSHLPSIVNNTCSSLNAMEPQRKSNFWTIDFEWQALQWTSLVGEMMTSTTWQFSHTFWNGGTIGLSMDNTPVTGEKKNVKTKREMKMNINIGKMWGKGRSIKKEINKTIHILYKQKEWNA